MNNIKEFVSVKAVKEYDVLILDFIDTPNYLSFIYNDNFMSMIKEKYFSDCISFRIKIINANLTYLSIDYSKCFIFTIENSNINQLFLSLSEMLLINSSTIGIYNIINVIKVHNKSFLKMSDSSINIIEYKHNNSFRMILSNSRISIIHMERSIIEITILKNLHIFKEVYAFILSTNMPIPTTKSFNIPNTTLSFNIGDTVKGCEYLSGSIIEYLIGGVI